MSNHSKHPGPRPAGPLPPPEFFYEIERAHFPTETKTRLYRVRPSVLADHQLFANNAATLSHCVTIERIDGAVVIIPNAYPWRDTDAWASWRWRKALAQGSKSGNPEPRA